MSKTGWCISSAVQDHITFDKYKEILYIWTIYQEYKYLIWRMDRCIEERALKYFLTDVNLVSLPSTLPYTLW